MKQSQILFLILIKIENKIVYKIEKFKMTEERFLNVIQPSFKITTKLKLKWSGPYINQDVLINFFYIQYFWYSNIVRRFFKEGV